MEFQRELQAHIRAVWLILLTQEWIRISTARGLVPQLALAIQVTERLEGTLGLVPELPGLKEAPLQALTAQTWSTSESQNPLNKKLFSRVLGAITIVEHF
jgi:hypothetical protein